MALSFGPIFDKKYPITRSYKAHPKVGCPGPDFGTPMGTPLKAVFDGTVVSGVNPDIPGKILPVEDWGKYIWLTYAKNRRIKVGYAHLSKFRVRSGKVKKGQVIAYSGNSGYSFGAHLHFALSYYGKCIDPLNNKNVVTWGEVSDMYKDTSGVFNVTRDAKAWNASAVRWYKDYKESKSDRAKLREQITKQNSQLKTLAGQVKKLQDNLKKANVSIDRSLMETGELEEKIADLNEKLKDAQKTPESPKDNILDRFLNWLRG